MYKLKYRIGQEPLEVFRFSTLQEVAEQVKQLFDDDTSINNILNTKKEYNIKIYLTYKKD